MYASKSSQRRSSLDRNRIELESADHPLTVERTHGHHAQARRRDCCFDDARQQQALRPEICLKLGELVPSPVESSYRNVGARKIGRNIYCGRARTQMRLVAGFPRWMVRLPTASVMVSSYSRRRMRAPAPGWSASPERNFRNSGSFS